MPDLRLGTCSSVPLSFAFERYEEPLRLFMVNADESGSMENRLDQNVLGFDKVAALIGGRADGIILHGFASDSCYDVLLTKQARSRLGWQEGSFRGLQLCLTEVASPQAAVQAGRKLLASHRARGSTNPASHPKFLEQLSVLLEAASVELELVVLNSSDGGLDGGAQSRITAQIEESMRRITGRARCLLAANVLVGTAGSPEALAFFTGDLDKYDNRLLFSTVSAAPGVLELEGFDPRKLSLSDESADQFTVQPALTCWTVAEGNRLISWHPEGTPNRPDRVTVRRSSPAPGGRRKVMRSEVRLEHRDVTLDRDGQEVFRLIARSLSDNPYLRESSRDALNALIAPLEALLGTRTAVLAMLVSPPEIRANVDALRLRIGENTAAIRGVLEQAQPDPTRPGYSVLSPRERSSRLNALNNARHILKRELREAMETMEQDALERELGFYESHPNHWLVWLRPAIDELMEQLGATQKDPGDVMAHLSTRIRTAKSVQDGKSRAADRYLDRVLEESRARRDHLTRKADPRDQIPFENPGRWTSARCPISGQALTDGLAAIPFVADRSDLTSGNLMSGGQNVDRMPIDGGDLLSLGAVRDLMWGELGQMASPYCTGAGWYNAAIPVLLGPATPAGLRDLERAIGWLCTGTSAFGPQMAEAIPGALAVLLGAPSDGSADPTPQIQALLRTTALLSRYRSYPYAPGTCVFDESSPKESLTRVWARSVEHAAGSACLQSMGCITSLFARALAADYTDANMVADDLFSWACRNIARSILGTSSSDGRGGVEGVLRLAALVHHAVELEGSALPGSLPNAIPALPFVIDSEGELDRPTLRWVLGPDLITLWPAQGPTPVRDFTDTVNALLSALPHSDQERLLPELDNVFIRLDAVLGSAVDTRLEAPPAPPAQRVPRSPQGFDDVLALESLRPQRYSTPVPGLSSAKARARRMTKGGKTQWVAPADAAVSENPSALAFIEGHTALYPLRAWLRLVEAKWVGQPALMALRARADIPPIPPVTNVLSRMAAIEGGMSQVILLLRRAFAFVVANANGYADNQWATSPLRNATAETIDAILGAVPVPSATPRRYAEPDPIDLSVPSHAWPRMDAMGYIPKSRAIGNQGQPIRPPPSLGPEERQGSAQEICQRASAAIIADLRGVGIVHIDGLHRAARRLLGEHPVDLQPLSPEEQHRVIIEELVPTLAGRVRGDPGYPRYFDSCANVLHQMIALGGDTRRFRAEEPAEFLAAEAAAILAAPAT